METVKVSRGKHFLKKGDRLKGLYIILQGSVRAVLENDEFDMEAGSIIGMLESLSGTYMCNYVANTDCVLYAFPYNSTEDYKKIFEDFLQSQNFSNSTANLKSAFTPIGMRKPVVNSNILFVGDAVGACDPLTLSGLRYALDSGEFCAKSIAKSKINIYKNYIKKLKFKFAITRLMQKVFYIKWVMCITFNLFCRCFGKFVSKIFNNFFVNKK